LIIRIFLKIYRYICLELELSFLHYIWNISNGIKYTECSKKTKFSQNKMLKITCLNNVLSIAYKTMIYVSF
jgi:hypothetical protein